MSYLPLHHWLSCHEEKPMGCSIAERIEKRQASLAFVREHYEELTLLRDKKYSWSQIECACHCVYGNENSGSWCREGYWLSYYYNMFRKLEGME